MPLHAMGAATEHSVPYIGLTFRYAESEPTCECKFLSFRAGNYPCGPVVSLPQSAPPPFAAGIARGKIRGDSVWCILAPTALPGSPGTGDRRCR